MRRAHPASDEKNGLLIKFEHRPIGRNKNSKTEAPISYAPSQTNYE
jgi:hypothetical protein